MNEAIHDNQKPMIEEAKSIIFDHDAAVKQSAAKIEITLLKAKRNEFYLTIEDFKGILQPDFYKKDGGQFTLLD